MSRALFRDAERLLEFAEQKNLTVFRWWVASVVGRCAWGVLWFGAGCFGVITFAGTSERSQGFYLFSLCSVVALLAVWGWPFGALPAIARARRILNDASLTLHEISPTFLNDPELNVVEVTAFKARLAELPIGSASPPVADRTDGPSGESTRPSWFETFVSSLLDSSSNLSPETVLPLIRAAWRLRISVPGLPGHELRSDLENLRQGLAPPARSAQIRESLRRIRSSDDTRVYEALLEAPEIRKHAEEVLASSGQPSATPG